ncbi:non-ribosomal peptide synthetase [Kibdelosporangium aridum]|uniref:Non-ribosomal peptide synthetase n=1 Tax=Kibdelosporangium aridum TaxID=2030 RepID=A0A428YC18_KIBAR|nr:non-ribosomal peptide synthetase [Kibdelosporangium aridum]RSM65099.1 non-ribosomal peptide synthetase [Kibdelosporangium aridum]
MTVWGPFPLSSGQTGIWNAQRIAPDVPLSVALYVEARGELDVALLADVFQRSSAEMRSPQLQIVEIDGTPCQTADSELRIDTEVLDLRSEAEPRAAAMRWMRQKACAPIDILSAPLTRFAVLRTGDTEHFCYFQMHHIAIDGYGAMLLLSRAAELYSAVDPGPSTMTDLSTIHESDADYRASPDFEKDKAFWREQLSGIPTAFSLSDRRAQASPGRRVESGFLDDQTGALLTSRARHAATQAKLLVAGLAGYFAAVTGERDVVLSLPVTARTTDALRRCPGFVSNVVPLHIPVAPDTTVEELVNEAGVRMRNAVRHQRYRHEDIRRDSDTTGSHRGFFGPMVNIMLFHNEVRFGVATGEMRVLATGPVEDLSVNIYTGAASIQVDFEANPERYTADELAGHHRRFRDYLRRFLAADAQTAVSEIAPMDDAERDLVVRAWNATDADVPATTLDALFAEQVARTPDAVALTFDGASLTYREFDERVDRLARVLAASGVGPESVVGLAIPRCVELVVGMYAIIRAGGAYLPIDPGHPVDRIRHVVGQADPVLVLTVSAHPVELPETLDVDTVEESGLPPVTNTVRPEHPAYVIFTSGSTGKPKGVVVSHAAIVNRLRWMQHAYPLDDTDVVVQKTPATFDVSVWEFFWPLQAGARLVVARPDGHRDPAYLASLIADENVTTAHFVPSMLAVFAEAQRCTSLRRVFCSGEALPPHTVRLFQKASPGAELHNLYGPTEAAVDVTAWTCTQEPETVPIGAPVWNTQVYVLDARLRPVPVGVTGELYLAGVQLARGYLGNAGLTAQRFVANPFRAGSRMYRTGDLVRWRADGNLEYLGRDDFQVKIRGLRIELGEIEAALLAEPGVAQAVCVARSAAHGGDELVGYLVAAGDATINVDALRAALGRVLPDYMVPRTLVVLDELPLGPNGKLDRGALPATEVSGLVRAPRTAVEHAVVGVFSEVLARGVVGIDDSFFDLGGDSLVASRAIARINATLGARLTIRDLFEAPRAVDLAVRVRAADGPSRVSAGDRPDRLPLSLAQQRLWFLNRFDRASAIYNMPFALRLSGELDVTALRWALTDVVGRHEILRTTFPDSGDGPYQVIHPAAVTLDEIDVPARELASALSEFAAAGFDLTVDRPIRMALFRTAQREHALAIVVHHIACDGWSFEPLARDLMVAFASRVDGYEPSWTPLPVQYADFALWQRAALGDENDPGSPLRRQIDHWTQRLAGLPGQLDLPMDRPRPRHPSHRGATHSWTIDAETHHALADLAARCGVSVFMVLHGALAVLLARLSATTDIAVGTPVAGRGDPAIDDLVGMFVNTLVLRTEIDLGEGFAALLDRVRDTDLDAFTHADVPFERLVEEMNPERSPSLHPLFQVMLSVEPDTELAIGLPGVTAAVAPISTGTVKIDLQLAVRVGTEMRAELGYATDLFDAATIEGFARRFTTILRAVADHADNPVGDLSIMDEHEPRSLVGDPAEPAVPLPELFTVSDPAAVAVRCDGADLSYGELDQRSNRLARVLIGEGVGPESVVALALPRSVESIVCVWAVAKTGAAFLPVDPGYPRARVDAMIRDCGVRIGLTSGRFRSALPDSVTWLDMDSIDLTAISAAPMGNRVRPDHPAYLIYTSGSTGTPKAVVVTHAGLASFARDITDRFGVTGSSRTLHFSSPSFDASVLELLMGFAAGATVVVAPTDVYGGAELADLLRDERVTHAFVTPAALATVDPAGLDDLGVVVVGGDETGPELVAAWAVGRRMFNAYGPTEATVAATASTPLRAGEPVTIGGPVRGTRLLVLDRRLNPVPHGVPGELYLAGPGLARGYHGRPGLTAERFVANPHGEPGERMYRTGDLVTVAPNRTLRFLGRADDQVKIRGYRIEPREIDAIMLTHPDVTFARTVVHQDRLASYVTTTQPVTQADLLAVARAALPGYMVPASVTVLDRIPLTPSGKVDRDALPTPELRAARVPLSDRERRLAEVFSEVLGHEHVGADDSFFDLGGNSLLATRLATAIGAAFGVELEVRAIFEEPTVAGLVDRITAAPPSRHMVTTPQARPARIPLSFAQQRIWFLNQRDARSGAYNVAFTLRLRGEVDVPALRAAIADVVERHETLRTVFPDSDDGPSQVVLHTAPAVPLTVESDVEERLRSLARSAFDLTVDPPLRAELFRTGDRDYCLAVVIHHIAVDGWSLAPLANDLVVAYQARRAGTTPGWAPLAVQYADYALSQRESHDDELAYWTRQLKGLPDELPLPYDRPRPATPTFHGAIHRFEVCDGVRDLARRHGVTLFMVLHSALAVLLRQVSGARDIAIGTPVAGRGDGALDNVVGMFVNSLVLRADVDPHATFADFLRANADTTLAAMAHSDIPFERVVDALKPVRTASRHPLFQVALVVEDHALPRLELPGVEMRVDELGTELAKFDLELRVTGADRFEFGYSTELFDATTVATIAQRFGKVLAAVVADPEIALGDIDVLTERERAAFAPARGRCPDRPVTLPELFAARHPDRVAVRAGSDELTYRELDERTNRMARALIARGVGTEDVVAIGLTRSIESVVATVAVAKTGAAFLAVDPRHPAARIRHMLADSCVHYGLGQDLSGDVDWLTFGELDGFSCAPVGDADRVRPIRIENTAYIIYTSGSTGAPKAVAVPHRGLSNFAAEQRERLGVTEQSRTLHAASLSFDMSVLELLLAFSAGATMVVAPVDVYGGDDLAELLERERVTHACLTPTALATIDPVRWPLPQLRGLIPAGEVCGTELVERWSAGRRMVNGYGPTETTIVATFSESMSPERPVVIGRPVRGVTALVLDERLRPVPVGVAGELYLGGGGLATGYLGQPGLTAQRFVADPFGTGERMYRTGDIVRWTADGELVYLGRGDDQVKVHGVRIELGEINAAVAACPGVRFAHTEVRRARIVTYVVAVSDAESIRAHVAERLPSHMVPAAVVALETVPRTETGKLDRGALPEPVFGSAIMALREPSTPNEKLVASIMADVAGLAHVGADDNFFDSGGNSLLATQVVARIATATGHRPSVRAVFDHPTPARLAALLDVDVPQERPVLVRQQRPERIPLSYAQQRLWFLNRFDVESAAYNIPVAMRLRGALDITALRQALRDVQQRHEVLRTVYPDSADGPYQLIRDGDIDLLTADDPDAFASRGFDLTVDEPLRAALFRVDTDTHLLVVVLHHIAMDGWSLTPLAKDLMTAYTRRRDGLAPGWDDLDVQYADYTLWQREALDSAADAQVEYWRRTLAGLPEHLDVPADRPRPPSPSHRGGSTTAFVEADVHRALLGLARDHDASLFMVLHTALAVLLHRLAATGDVVIGTPIAGRTVPQLDPLIGMFVNMLVLRTEVTGERSFAELLRAVRENDLNAFAHADVPFERLVEELNPGRCTAHQPFFQVTLLLRDPAPDVRLPGLDVDVAEVDAGATRFDLQFTVTERDGLDLQLTYAADLFDPDTAAAIGQRFVRLLSAAVADPDRAVGDLDVLLPAEASAVRGPDPGAAVTFRELFAAAVAVDPNAVALRCDGAELTYAELDRRANQLARALIGRGAGPETFVALGLVRSMESVLAMLAVTKAGAAFVPIDPAYPHQRKAHMLADAGVTTGLTTVAQCHELPSDLDWLPLDDPAFAAEVASMSPKPVTGVELRLDHPAYLVYTSGSTGVPKGVTVTHAGLSNFAYETAERFQVRSGCRVLHFSSPSFDGAVLDLMLAFGGAATVVVTPPGIYGGTDLTRLLAAERITHAFITTSALATTGPGELGDLTHLLVGGEACPPDLVGRWAPGRGLHNVYGPTETTIVTTMGPPMAPDGPITIGGPIRGATAMILDDRLRPVPVGVTGELYLAGPGLARGYHRRPGLTAERFVANPYGKPGERMYRTGDRVRWSPRTTGPEIEYVGRADHQVKIRGFRIEPGEIDAVLCEHADVEFSRTIGHEMPNGTTVLVSYVKLAPGATADLRAHARDRLPGYLVPQSITVLDSVPLDPVGKLDRGALPEPVFSVHKDFRAPRTVTEAALCEAFAIVLGMDSVSAQDGFFELGGNSLLATRVVATVRERHGIEVPVQAMFVDPTPAAIAGRIDTAHRPSVALIDAALDPLLPIRSHGAKSPLFCVHPALGLSWCYTGLLSHLDAQRPLYGLQSPHITDGTAFDSIQQAAARYISEIKKVQPNGPYHLLGWSLGGLIAHETAVRLRDLGDDVALLAMMDSFIPPADSAADTDIAELLDEFGIDIDLPGDDITLAQVAELVRGRSALFAALTPAHFERLHTGYTGAFDLARGFEPGRYDGDIVFFTASADTYNIRNATAWRPFVCGEIHDHAVDCKHSMMTNPEALAVIGPVLQRYLDKAEHTTLRRSNTP